jgi:hypothetical protein
VLKAEQAYIDGVIYKEWPLMFSSRSEDVSVDDMLHSAIVTTARLHPADVADLGLRQQILNYLEQAHTQRTIRTFQLGSGVPVDMAGVESGRALVSFSVAFAAAVAAILVLIHLLEQAPAATVTISHQPGAPPRQLTRGGQKSRPSSRFLCMVGQKIRKGNDGRLYLR